MFNVNQQVVCTNDQFHGPIRRLFTALPVKDKVYTIRRVYSARSVAFPKVAGSADGEIGVLLNDLVNPVDPKSKHQQELGFSVDRFAPLKEDVEKMLESVEVTYAGKQYEHVPSKGF